MKVSRYPSMVLAILFIGAFAVESYGKSIFMESQVLIRDKKIDIFAYRMVGRALENDSNWICDSLRGPLYPTSCKILPYASGVGAQEEYIYWAFLQLSKKSISRDLSTHQKDQEKFFDSLPRPLVALKESGDSCYYLVLFRNLYSPLAAGKVSCPDLNLALREIDLDLGHQKYIPSDEAKDPRTVKAYHKGEFLVHGPNSLDLGLEGSVGLYAGFSDDEKKDANNPFHQPIQRFDFNDLAESKGIPFSVRAFMKYRNVIGLRLGFGYSQYLLERGHLNAINQNPQLLTKINEWAIDRTDYSLEIILGRAFSTHMLDIALYGYSGTVSVNFKERIQFGSDELKIPGLLSNETGFLLGIGSDLIIKERVLLGLELGLLFKGFSFKTDPQPDGTGNEFQLRLRLGGLQRFYFGQ